MSRPLRPRPRSLPGVAPPARWQSDSHVGKVVWVDANNLFVPPALDDLNQWIATTSEVPPLVVPPELAKQQEVGGVYNFTGGAFYPPGQYRDLVGDIDFLQTSRPHLFASEVQSTFSYDAPSSAGSTFSPVQTERGDALTSLGHRSPCPSPAGKTITTVEESETNNRNGASGLADYQRLVCLGPQCHLSFQSDKDLRTHVQAVHTHTCSWAGCQNPSFASRTDLAWHVKAEHLLICPVLACSEISFQSNRELQSHIAVEHPDSKRDAVKEWELPPPATASPSDTLTNVDTSHSAGELTPTKSTTMADSKFKAAVMEVMSVSRAKKRCQEQLWNVIEKKARKSAGTPRTADSPTDLVRCRASRSFEAASFPLVFEHCILPFLTEFIPKWSGPRHVISCTRGRTPQHRRICIMTTAMMSRTRKIIIARHIADLLPDQYRRTVSFVFSVGQTSRATCWARGLSKSNPDDVRSAKNPYHFSTPCMGDSVGTRGEGHIQESTATLGPCLEVNGGVYWLVNFHPFLDAYQNTSRVDVEHPSPQDRAHCVAEDHDAMSESADFKLGQVTVTSGLNLKTTRISHDSYWDECAKEAPLVVTDWALIAADSPASRANMLRRFPSETQPPTTEPLVKSACSGVAGVSPGAPVISSGRTSGFQRGQVCEIPAYVSAEENGTGKATREWFVEEPYPPWNGEEAWIRGGIGVEGDSGAAIVDAETNCLMGQLWGRNKYWGPGPRITFFTPAADVFDDIQEKCGLQCRPQLPQTRDDADRYAVYPSCRRCYDLQTYLDSRRSSRVSLQSMINYRGEPDHDLTSIENVSELATPRSYPHPSGTGVEEIGSSFGMTTLSPLASFNSRFAAFSPPGTSVRSPYPQTLVIDDSGSGPDLRDALLEAEAIEPPPKRRSICLEPGGLYATGHIGNHPKRTKTGR